jgi:hypothetical protein
VEDIQQHGTGYWFRLCDTCGKHIKNKYKSQIKQKTCSHSCQLKGNKFRTGKVPANAFERGETANDKNINWRGAEVSYGALHDWVSYYLGRPQQCENCDTTEHWRYEWANISGEYKRELSDWARLCKNCHVLIDDTIRKGRITKSIRVT